MTEGEKMGKHVSPEDQEQTRAVTMGTESGRLESKKEKEKKRWESVSGRTLDCKLEKTILTV